MGDHICEEVCFGPLRLSILSDASFYYQFLSAPFYRQFFRHTSVPLVSVAGLHSSSAHWLWAAVPDSERRKVDYG